MQTNESGEQKTFVDDRAKQESLIKDPDVVNRTEPDSRIDTAAGDSFADDRVDQSNDQEETKQAGLTTETVGDGNQLDLTGETAGETPEWE